MKKQFQFKLSYPKRDLKVRDVSITGKQIKHAIEMEVKNALKHFNAEDGGWKIRKCFIESEILRNIFGFFIEDEINQAFLNEDLIIEYNDKGDFIRTKQEYNPIYINQRTGKLYIVENSDDKSYLKKFRESNGYVEIGKL